MRFLAPFALLLVSLAGALGIASGQLPAAAPRAAAPTAPPEPGEQVLALRRSLQALIPSRSSARYGVIVVSLDRGDTLFSLNPDLPLAPASNMKLFSTGAALYYLGPNFRFSTYALGTGDVVDGVLQGDLVLYGTGDPAISRRMLESSLASIEALVDSVAARGVREIAGDVVGDGSYFDDAWIGQGWKDADRMAWYAAPVGALSFAENMVSVRVLPGSGAGEPARVRTSPETEGLAITNRVRTVASGATRVRFEHGEDGLVLEGQIARRHPGIARSLPVVDPGNYAAAALRAVLEERGIAVRGGVRSIRDAEASPVTIGARSASSGNPAGPPPARVLGVHLSPTLAEITEVTNQISHNLYAEAMLKTVGRVALGDGSFAGGARAVQYFLECEAGVDPSTLQIVDGSGLSRHNRVTARSTAHLLGYMTESGAWDTYLASLPEAARPHALNHSLRRRMGSTAAEGNLRAKTGTIQNVSALSGYVTAANGERLAFSIIANDASSTWGAKRTEDAIGARLAQFTRPRLAGEPVAAEPAPTAEPTPEPTAATTPAAPQAEAATEPEPPARPATRTHRVRSGETLDGIARRYDTTVRELQRLNPGLQPRRLQIGQQVRVPGG